MLPTLRKLICGCDFVGFDMEFTGLHSALLPGGQHSLYDYPGKWYQKARRSVQQFTVCQLGLSIFSSENSNKYMAHSYNFFLFPATFGQMDSEFSFQAFSIKFLAHYGFDFNKVAALVSPISANKVQKNAKVRKEHHEEILLQILVRVALVIGKGFQMFEIQLVLRKALQDIWTVPLGNQEPLVGHNMLMDLLHLHDKFYNPLPEDYEEFKKNIHILFPIVIDTKNVAKAIWKECEFPHASNLLEVFELLCSDLNPTNASCPEVFHASDCLRYATKKFPHEAAYDAFLCGSVLLKTAHLLLCRISCDPARTSSSFSQYLDVLAPYVNQVNLIRARIQKIVS
uniref:Uncharacterized protein n=1 Tax=Sphaerodactylus townsendi TaxID=933632 RepID=A0ACB8GB56_9SAUR